MRCVIKETWYKQFRHARRIYAAVPSSQIIGHICKRARGFHTTKLIELPAQMRTFYANAKGVPEYINLMEDSQRKSIHKNLAVSNAVMVAIAMQ